jgi:hypothetical protein
MVTILSITLRIDNVAPARVEIHREFLDSATASGSGHRCDLFHIARSVAFASWRNSMIGCVQT